MDRLKRAAERDENTMPLILDAVWAYATVGEIRDAFRDVSCFVHRNQRAVALADRHSSSGRCGSYAV